jgi:hypothetical protein
MLYCRAVFTYLKEQRAIGKKVPDFRLKAQALITAKKHGVEGFVASQGWLRRWKRTYNVGIRCATNYKKENAMERQGKLLSFHTGLGKLLKGELSVVNDDDIVAATLEERATNIALTTSRDDLEALVAKHGGCTDDHFLEQHISEEEKEEGVEVCCGCHDKRRVGGRGKNLWLTCTSCGESFHAGVFIMVWRV